ncbi:flavin reductase family protein [Saccharopolyspora sp. MS10]|uniref:flavin reductase family protein n=1 Tax=Saccharopolyspora sp. MS10 TaxID=3385973 RepID=UPI0039A26D09
MSARPTPATEVDPAVVREVHRRFVTGVTVVTTMDGGTPRGLAVNAFCSVSLEPPLVLVCVQTSSSTYPALLRSEHLGINILAADQVDVAGVFATKAADKFAELSWSPGPHGSPLLDGAAARVEVEIGERLRARTHTVFLGRIVEADHRDVDPLVYRAGQFFSPSDMTAL